MYGFTLPPCALYRYTAHMTCLFGWLGPNVLLDGVPRDPLAVSSATKQIAMKLDSLLLSRGSQSANGIISRQHVCRLRRVLLISPAVVTTCFVCTSLTGFRDEEADTIALRSAIEKPPKDSLSRFFWANTRNAQSDCVHVFFQSVWFRRKWQHDRRCSRFSAIFFNVSTQLVCDAYFT